MIDTIKPKYRSNYIITNFSEFKSNIARLFEKAYYPNGHVETLRELPPKKNPLHLQALTFTKIKYDFPVFLSEGSLAKQLFGNNLLELTNVDFDNAVLALKNTYHQQNIEIISIEAIKGAELKRCDFGKNIILPKNALIKSILEELSKTKKTNSHLNIEKIIFKNEGNELIIRCKSYEIVFYDKTKELEEQGIFLNYNIFRIEVRLKNERVLASKLEKSGYIFEHKITLRDVYNEAIAKSVLLYFWNLVISNLPKTIRIEDFQLRIQQLGNNTNKLNLRKEFMFLGMNYMERKVGASRFYALIKQHFPKDSTLNDIKREYKEYTSRTTISVSEGINMITEALNEFILITPAVLEELTNNSTKEICIGEEK